MSKNMAIKLFRSNKIPKKNHRQNIQLSQTKSTNCIKMIQLDKNYVTIILLSQNLFKSKTIEQAKTKYRHPIWRQIR
jgi:hypothetical protein